MATTRGLSFGLILALLAAGCTEPEDNDPPRRDVAREDVPAETRPVADDGGLSPQRSAGVFIGVEKFSRDPKLADVIYAVNDAVDLAYALSVEHELLPVDRVRLLLSGEPSGGSERRLQEMVERGAVVVHSAEKHEIDSVVKDQAKGVGAEGILYIFIASHGYADGDQHLLMAEDSILNSADTGITAAGLLEATQVESGGLRLLILDTCRKQLVRPQPRGHGSSREEGPRSARPVMPIKLVNALVKLPRYAVFTAAGPDEFAWPDKRRPNGIFTGAILDGLHCGSATNQQGSVTLMGLASFVQQEAAKRSDLLQRPEIRTGGGVGDFTLLLCDPPKPVGEILEPREGQTDPPGVVRARINQDGYYATAVLFVESNRVFYNQQHLGTFLAKKGVELRLPVHYGGPGRFQVYLGLSADPNFLVGEDQPEGLPVQDSQGRPVHWFGPVHVVLP